MCVYEPITGCIISSVIRLYIAVSKEILTRFTLKRKSFASVCPDYHFYQDCCLFIQCRCYNVL